MSMDPTIVDGEVERYELREPTVHRFGANRREFIQVLGAGVVVAAAATTTPGQQRRRGARGPRREERLSERFHLGDNGIVTVLTSKVEVGQGARTQLTQAAAEELRLPVEQVRLIMADTGQCPDDGGTSGSRTTPSTVPQVRAAAAALRERLIDRAAERLKVNRPEIRFEQGKFAAGGQSLSLADLFKDPELAERLQAPAGDGVAVARVQAWRVLGTPVPKVDGRDVVTGAAKFPSDIVRPGMLYGRILRPASIGAKLESIDLGPARAMKDVTVVRDGEFVGCAASTSWQATAAIDAVAATAAWTKAEGVASSDVFAHFKKTAQSGRGDAEGDAAHAIESADKRYSADFTIAYIQHAPMEPRSAVAEWTDGKLTVWTGTQQPSRVQGELCEAFRLPEERVRVIVPDTGGGFGGKHSGEAAVEAARLAKAAGRPVSLRWTREEEFTWAYFRPAGLIEVRAGLDSRGRIAGWDFTNYNSGGSAIETPYAVPSRRTQFRGCESPLRQGSYRALASTANTFARESAMDELAALAGADPLDFRLSHLEEGRLKDVLLAAADKFGWRERGSGRIAGRGFGLACGTEKGSFVAACAHVEVRDGRIRVLSITQAFECGAIQNPRNLQAQVVGSIIMGLGGALTEQIEFREGRILNPAFSSYPVPRMDDVPELDVVLLDRRDLPSVGAGETPIIATAPAIANAVCDASGVRPRSMPLKL